VEALEEAVYAFKAPSLGAKWILIRAEIVDETYSAELNPPNQQVEFAASPRAAEGSPQIPRASTAHSTIGHTDGVAPDELVTERMRAERLRGDHLEELVDLHRDEQVMATLGGVRRRTETDSFLEANLEHWRRHRFGLWMFRRSADGAFVGRAGLRRVHVGGADEVEIAYAVTARAWGCGLATEMARALIGVGFGELRLTTLVAFTLVENAASIRVMEKAGLRFERAIVHRRKPHVLYAVSRDRWTDCAAAPAGSRTP
jgi:[ribosomal protein S5]-alanine N-acetyltransferase